MERAWRVVSVTGPGLSTQNLWALVAHEGHASEASRRKGGAPVPPKVGRRLAQEVVVGHCARRLYRLAAP